jgi:tungstate transport system permease protein
MVDELLGIAGLSLYVASASTAFASLLGIPLGAFLALREEARGRRPILIVTPIVTGVTYSAVASVGRDVKDAARSLGAKGWPLTATVIEEARLGVLTAVMVGFGRAISEVGAVLIVGGNIRGSTRTLTTSIVLETGRGNFAEAVGLGAVLLVIAFGIFLILRRMQERGYR